MISLTLYTNNSDNAVISKDLTELTELQGVLKENCSIIDPEILLQGIEADMLSKINYCYIPSFGRYYYVRNITIERTSLWRMSLHVDVLKSFESQIKKCPALFSMQETEANLYLSGTHVPLLAQKKSEILAFEGIQFSPNGIADSSLAIVLATVGEAQSE